MNPRTAIAALVALFVGAAGLITLELGRLYERTPQQTSEIQLADVKLARASFALYNTKPEVDRLAEALIKAQEFFV